MHGIPTLVGPQRQYPRRYQSRSRRRRSWRRLARRRATDCPNARVKLSFNYNDAEEFGLTRLESSLPSWPAPSMPPTRRRPSPALILSLWTYRMSYSVYRGSMSVFPSVSSYMDNDNTCMLDMYDILWPIGHFGYCGQLFIILRQIFGYLAS